MVTAFGFNGTSLMKMPWVCGRWPVSSEARVGEQTGIPATAWVKFTHSRSKRSKFGVFTFVSPAKPKACARHWSAMTMSTFGGAAAKAGRGSANPTANHATVTPKNRFMK